MTTPSTSIVAALTQACSNCIAALTGTSLAPANTASAALGQEIESLLDAAGFDIDKLNELFSSIRPEVEADSMDIEKYRAVYVSDDLLVKKTAVGFLTMLGVTLADIDDGDKGLVATSGVVKVAVSASVAAGGLLELDPVVGNEGKMMPKAAGAAVALVLKGTTAAGTATVKLID
jgi:hypothetical protein